MGLPQWRRGPVSLSLISRVSTATIVLTAALTLPAAVGGTARGEESECAAPVFMQGEPGTHYHPVITIVLFRRNPDPANPEHDVIRLITPPKGLGIEPPPSGAEPGEAVAYRTIHVHDDDGALHVEPRLGEDQRVCAFLRLWSGSSEAKGALQDLQDSRTVHVRIGEHYIKNMPLADLLQLPLNHDLPVIIFVEEKIPA